MTTRYYPTGGANRLNRYTKTLLASALILAFNSAQALDLTPPEDPADWDGPGKWLVGDQDPEVNEYRLDSGEAIFDEINSTIKPFITHDEYFVSASNGSVLTVKGKTMLDSDSSVYVSDSYDQGTYAFHAADSAKMFFNGDIDVTTLLSKLKMCIPT